jgi:ketosteroid isomerase-like protein
VERAVHEFAAAITENDPEAIEKLVSSKEVRVIGTDPAEYWGPDRADVVKRLQVQVQELAGQVVVKASDPEGYAEGTVGWVADQPVLRLPDGSEMQTRLTAVLSDEDGRWRFVQIHYSMGVSNEEALGQELST